MEKDYFDEYMQVKLILNQLICEIYKYSITKEEADDFDIKYTDDDEVNSNGELVCVFHRYNPEAMLLWNRLGINNSIVLIREMLDLRKEEKVKNKNYYKDYLELKLIDKYLIEGCYINIDESEENRSKI